MKKNIGKERVNWPLTILLILGLITVAFPLYMTIMIAFKQPSEMTNSIAGKQTFSNSEGSESAMLSGTSLIFTDR